MHLQLPHKIVTMLYFVIFLLFTGLSLGSLQPKPRAFGVMALRSATPIHFGQVTAVQNNIFINLPKQDAVCEIYGPLKPPGQAIFYIKDQILYLYTGSGPTQKIFVDRSGFGMFGL